MKSAFWIWVCTCLIFSFSMAAGYAEDELVVDENGNVGIGVANPQLRLDINGNSRIGNLQIGTWPRSNGFVFFGSDLIDQSQAENYALLQHITNGRTYLNSPLDLRFRINNADKMIIDNSSLNVYGAIRAFNSDLYFTKTDHNHTGVGNTAGHAAIENAANYDALMILGRSGTAKGRNVRLWDYLQVNGSMDVTGNVGIGTTNPQAQLDVAGIVLSNGVPLTSDFRWKENINPIEDALDLVSNLRGVKYEWIDKSKGGGQQIGMIAQEVEEVFPQVVHTDSHGYKSVDYSKLVAPLIEAIKDLKAENETLKNNNRVLKSDMEDIYARLERLENQ